MDTKPWGSAQTVYADDSIQVERLEIRRGGYSSIHVHHRKCNGLLVYEGVLLVQVEGWASVYLRADSGILMVPAGMPHRFTALSDVRALEISRARPDETLDPLDITRLRPGGLNPDISQFPEPEFDNTPESQRSPMA